MPASWINGSTKSISGTSMAAPVIAGAIAVMQEASETILGRRLLVDEVEQILGKTLTLFLTVMMRMTILFTLKLSIRV